MALYLSHSQTKTWRQCPRQWELTKYHKVRQAPGEALIVGDAVHQAIEADGRRYMAHGDHLSADELRTVAEGAMGERVLRDDPGGLLDLAAETRMRAKLYSSLSGYALYMRPDYRPYRVEEGFTFPVPGAADLHFTGRIDAMVRDSRGAAVVLDIKTGRPWRQGDEHTDPQAAAYLWAAGIWFPEPAPARLTFVFLPHGYQPERRTTHRTPTQIVHYAGTVRQTAAAITAAKASGDFPAKPSALCAWCGVLGACRTGREYLLANGRQPQVPVLMAAGEGATA